ncbi:MAG: M6 family metalloprotease domain-containing protein [archaeon]
MTSKTRVTCLAVFLSIVVFTTSPLVLEIEKCHAFSDPLSTRDVIEDHQDFQHRNLSEKSQSPPILGTQNMIVVLVNFPDKSNLRTIPQINDIIFSKLNDFFLRASYGKMRFAGSISKWYLLPRPMSYYGGDGSGSERCRDLIEDSLSISDADVDFSQFRYVMIVHSGEGGATSSTRSTGILSFASLGPISARTNDGALQLSVCVVSEFDTLGVLAHETGHMLGLPDLYDYDSKETFVGEWDLMAEGDGYRALFDLTGGVPNDISSWGRMKLGWIDATQILTVKSGESLSASIEDLQVRSSSTKTVILPITRNQYFLIETRTKAGFYSWSPWYMDRIRLIVYYVDETLPSGRGPVKIQNIVSPSNARPGAAPQTIAKDSYRLVITVLDASTQSFAVKVDYAGYGFSVRTGVANTPLMIDDCEYLTDGAGSLNLNVSFATHHVLIASTVQKGGGTRRIFTGWSDGVASFDREVKVQSDITLNANYVTQHLLNVVSERGSAQGAGWYDEGKQATFSVTSPIDSDKPGTRHLVTGYSGDARGLGSSGTTVMDGQKTVTFTWVKQYLLSVSSKPSAIANPPGSGWYNEGESVTLRAPTVKDRRFLSWTLDSSPRVGSVVTILMNQPHQATANYA